MIDRIDEELEDDLEEAGMAPDDYGFIIDHEGNLKAVYLPDDAPAKHPKNVQKILKMFGVQDVGQIDDPTIH